MVVLPFIHLKTVKQLGRGGGARRMQPHTVNVDCAKFEYVVLAKYHHMLIFEFDLLTKQHILILCKSCSSCVLRQPRLSSWVLH